MVAAWPQADLSDRDATIEERFAIFQAVLGALREIRSRQGIAPKLPIEFCVRGDDDTVNLLRPMEPYFAAMANATSVGWGPHVQPPATAATVNLSGLDVLVDLKDFIDVDAEIARNEKQRERLVEDDPGQGK